MGEQVKIFTKTPVIVSLAIIATLLWGSAFPCIKIGYDIFEIGGDDIFTKILFAGYRFALAGLLVILCGSLLQKKLILPSKINIKGIIWLGFVQTTLEYAFFYIGVAHTTGIKSSILYSINIFIVVILAHFFYKNDRLNFRKSVGCIAGFLGVVIINLGGGSLGGGFSFAGEGMIILAATAFGVGALINKKVAQQGDSMTITGYQLLIGGLVLVVVGVLGGGTLQWESSQAVAMMFYLAILSSVAFTIWTILLKYNGAGRIAIYNFLIPVFGVLLSAFLLGESVMELKNVFALILVCVGIYIINKPTKITAEIEIEVKTDEKI